MSWTHSVAKSFPRFDRICAAKPGRRVRESCIDCLMQEERPAEMAADQLAAPSRLLMNLCILAVESVPRGGKVTIEATETGGGARIRIVAEGPRARLNADAVLALEGQAPETGYDGRSIQPYFAGLMARNAGGRVSAHVSDERVEFVALLQPHPSTAG